MPRAQKKDLPKIKATWAGSARRWRVKYMVWELLDRATPESREFVIHFRLGKIRSLSFFFSLSLSLTLSVSVFLSLKAEFTCLQNNPDQS